MSIFIVENEPKSPVSEAYRTLRTNIQFSSFDKEIKSILVTSSGPEEGKSTTIGNLAFAMTQAGKKVVLVDCDLRKPSVHKKFSISNMTGLSNYLVGEIDFEGVLTKYSDNLHIIPSGTIPPNPAEMISSNKMKSFIQRCKEEYDCILLDAPPVIAVTDAQLLSTEVDGVLLVVASQQADKDAVKKAKELLQNVKANIIGVVLTKTKSKSGYGKGYGYYYYYSEEDGKGKKKRKKKK
nr:CpsD/CapB family tyrosine-protein kinase [Clostridium guangxiense]